LWNTVYLDHAIEQLRAELEAGWVWWRL